MNWAELFPKFTKDMIEASDTGITTKMTLVGLIGVLWAVLMLFYLFYSTIQEKKAERVIKHFKIQRQKRRIKQTETDWENFSFFSRKSIIPYGIKDGFLSENYRQIESRFFYSGFILVIHAFCVSLFSFILISFQIYVIREVGISINYTAISLILFWIIYLSYHFIASLLFFNIRFSLWETGCERFFRPGYPRSSFFRFWIGHWLGLLGGAFFFLYLLASSPILLIGSLFCVLFLWRNRKHAIQGIPRGDLEFWGNISAFALLLMNTPLFFTQFSIYLSFWLFLYGVILFVFSSLICREIKYRTIVRLEESDPQMEGLVKSTSSVLPGSQMIWKDNKELVFYPYYTPPGRDETLIKRTIIFIILLNLFIVFIRFFFGFTPFIINLWGICNVLLTLGVFWLYSMKIMREEEIRIKKEQKTILYTNRNGLGKDNQNSIPFEKIHRWTNPGEIASSLSQMKSVTFLLYISSSQICNKSTRKNKDEKTILTKLPLITLPAPKTSLVTVQQASKYLFQLLKTNAVELDSEN